MQSNKATLISSNSIRILIGYCFAPVSSSLGFPREFVLINVHIKVHTTPFRIGKNILPLRLYLNVALSKSFVFLLRRLYNSEAQ